MNVWDVGKCSTLMFDMISCSTEYSQYTRGGAPRSPAHAIGQYADSWRGSRAREGGWVVGSGQRNSCRIRGPARQRYWTFRLQGQVGPDQADISHRVREIWTGEFKFIWFWATLIMDILYLTLVPTLRFLESNTCSLHFKHHYWVNCFFLGL